MNLSGRFLAPCLTLLLAGTLLAETQEERARKVTVTLKLTDVPPGAAAHFVEVLSKVKVHYQGRPGDQTLLSIDVENASADEALKEIARLANLELTYAADGAHFAPKK